MSDENISLASEANDRRIDADEDVEFDSPVVKILVGQDKTPFHIREAVLTRNSAFFLAALKKEWQEGETREVKLPEEDPINFRRYAKYLFTGLLACKGESIPHEYDLLASSYALGERLLDDGYRDAVLDSILITTQEDQGKRYPDDNLEGNSYPGIASVRTIYEATTKGSPARRMMVDLYVIHAGWNFKYETEEDKAHHEFLVDLCEEFSWKRKISDDSEISEFDKMAANPLCEYHHHKEGEPCRAKRRRLSP